MSLAYKRQLSIDSCTENEGIAHFVILLAYLYQKIIFLVSFYFFFIFVDSLLRETKIINNEFQKSVNNTLKALNMTSVLKSLNEGKCKKF